MIRKKRPKSSSLFLMELILAILFFSIASAVCVQFFVKSHLLSRDSDALSHAANECASVAEILDSADSVSDFSGLLLRLYPDSISLENVSDNDNCTETEIFLNYNEEFFPCSEKTASYTLYLHIAQSGQMLTANMKFCSGNSDTVYELEAKHHIARRTGYEKR